MKRLFFYLVSALSLICGVALKAETPALYSISGQVIDAKTSETIVGVGINLKDTGIWTVTDEDGRFTIRNIPQGSCSLVFACLGYTDRTLDFKLSRNIESLTIKLEPNTLALKTVVVTAQRDKDGLNSSLQFSSNALEHLQISNVTDIGALLPGGKTINPDLTKDSPISLRDGGLNTGNAAFGTAVEVDGVRIGNNASFGNMSGAGTRNVSTENISSIEVITGVPSAEYGDLNSGMVRIHTKKGITPYRITFSANPRTYLTSVSKGFDLKKNRGILNVSGEWTRATSKLTSPYTSYTRRSFSASYNNIFFKTLKFESGLSANLGGMNSENDPDAITGTFSKARDNSLRAYGSLVWAVKKPWITNLKFDASLNYNDNYSQDHLYSSSASVMPAVHATSQGYYLASRLPLSYFSDRIVDSKELDLAASLKYEWFAKFDRVNSKLKAGAQWKSNGNVGQGEYYLDPDLSASGYRPRPYRDYPFMHNLAVYAEEALTIPIGRTKVELSAGLRMENIFVSGTEYKNVSSLSPRLNAKWTLSDVVSVRGGWGVSEKLPSFYILYPVQQYRDIQTFSFSHGESASYVYYTQPYKTLYNENLVWQKNYNSEFAVDLEFEMVNLSITAFYNKTKAPYTYRTLYSPFSYNIMSIPSDFTVPSNPEISVDSQSGIVYMRGDGQEFWTPMETKVTDKSFFASKLPSNGADIHRGGLEVIADFPEISLINTKFRFDASYSYTQYVDTTLTQFYRTGWSHTSLPNRSYQYVGIYAGTDGNSIYNGKQKHSLNANLTSITHIPQARLIITCRLEMSLFERFRNLSTYKGQEYAYNVSAEGTASTGGSIYDGNSYTAIRPVQYMDENGAVHDFTDVEAADPQFANLILKSGNAYTFTQDGYGAYFSANLSVTKEIGDSVSLSFFANNFTNSRMSVTSLANGMSAVFTPAFYYGLTCRIKF